MFLDNDYLRNLVLSCKGKQLGNIFSINFVSGNTDLLFVEAILCSCASCFSEPLSGVKSGAPHPFGIITLIVGLWKNMIE